VASQGKVLVIGHFRRLASKDELHDLRNPKKTLQIWVPTYAFLDSPSPIIERLLRLSLGIRASAVLQISASKLVRLQL
jgi:hypothetical protein